jgi:excinuclease ABC subunit C
LPRRIECIDVSHHAGTDTVAVIVAFRDGEPDRRRYRSFHVRNVRGGDDYAAMHEVLLRRFRRAQAEEKEPPAQGAGRWSLPDLMLVDGGKGQLGIAQAALEELGITQLPLAALAKEKENARGDKQVDRVYLPGRLNAIELRGAGSGLRILAHARDEAHRASNALRLKLGKRSKLGSGLERIAGVGPKTRKALLTHFGSLSDVSGADLEQLLAAGVTRRQAQAIHEHFHGAEAASAQTEDDAVENAFR